MQLHNIRLKGFRGFSAGVGLEEVNLDLSRLPAGLVAVVGKNGMGKTTLLDNLHPFRLMPYKLRESKEWSPNSFSYYDQCYGEAAKELVFEMNGTVYRSVILIDADRRKQEAYLYQQDGAAWTPLNDGKTRTYDAAVEKVCGSPSLFFTSVFRSQDARKLSSYPRSEILSIICELLNIDGIKAQGEKAKEVANALLADIEQKRGQIEVLDVALADEPRLKGELEGVEVAIAGRDKELAGYKEVLAGLDAKYRETEVASAAQVEARKRLTDMQERKAEINKQMTDTFTEESVKVKDLDDQIVKIGRERVEANTGLDLNRSRVGSIETQIAALRKELEEVASLQADADQEPVVSADLAAAKKRLEDLQQQFRDGQQKLTEISDLKSEILRAETRSAGLVETRMRRKTEVEAAIKRDTEQSAMLANLDCKADASGWVNDACPLLESAVAAKNRIPGLETELAGLQETTDEEKAAEDQEKILKGRLEAMGDPQKDLTVLANSGKAQKTAVEDLEQKLAGIQKSVTRMAELKGAGDRISDLENQKQQIEELVVAGQSRLATLERDVADLEGKKKIVTEEFAAKKQEITTRADDLQRDIDALARTLTEDVSKVLAEIQGNIDRCKEDIARQETAIRQFESQAGAIRGQLSALAVKVAERSSFVLDIEDLDGELANWQLLVKACSNDGIVALELDDAGPSIAALANDLLTACYGPRFSVRLETQTAKVDGSLKETFDITVFDAERDEEKSIRDMSGGEVTWVEDAITRAISLYNVGKSCHVFGTLFTDEKDGALDSDRKQEFLAIKRRALEVGSHSQEFYITQTPEMQEAADARIVLAPGSVTIR